jgi:hypothetical protein
MSLEGRCTWRDLLRGKKSRWWFRWKGLIKGVLSVIDLFSMLLLHGWIKYGYKSSKHIMNQSGKS